jgi:uncharacterized protein DUF2798
MIRFMPRLEAGAGTTTEGSIVLGADAYRLCVTDETRDGCNCNWRRRCGSRRVVASGQTAPMIPARYGGAIALLITSVIMSCIVSGVSTAKSIGFAPGIVSAWLSAWASSWMIAFPVLLVVLPLVQRIVGALVRRTQNS